MWNAGQETEITGLWVPVPEDLVLCGSASRLQLNVTSKQLKGIYSLKPKDNFYAFLIGKK